MSRILFQINIYLVVVVCVVVGERKKKYVLNALYKYSQRLLTLDSTVDFNYAAASFFLIRTETLF